MCPPAAHMSPIHGEILVIPASGAAPGGRTGVPHAGAATRARDLVPGSSVHVAEHLFDAITWLAGVTRSTHAGDQSGGASPPPSRAPGRTFGAGDTPARTLRPTVEAIILTIDPDRPPTNTWVRDAAKALRLIDPAVPIVSIGLPAGEGDELLDARLPQTAGAVEISRTLQALRGETAAERGCESNAAEYREPAAAAQDRAPRLAPPDPSPADHRAHAHTPPSPPVAAADLPHDVVTSGVRAMQELLAHGELGADAAVAALRAISGRPGLTLEPNAVDDEEPRGRTVEDHGVRFGRLIDRNDAQNPPPALLAQWLAAHLSMARQHRLYREMAHRDDLTDTWNRRYMRAFLARSLATAREVRRPVTLLLFDIDDFKQFNDTFGHRAGDDLLRETVSLLTSVIRTCDRVCRIGGDEFLVIFADPGDPRTPDSDHPRSAEMLAERFRDQIRQARFPKLGSEAPGSVTISGGIATYPWDALDMEALLETADARLLASKQRGKNCITYGPGASTAE